MITQEMKDRVLAQFKKLDGKKQVKWIKDENAESAIIIEIHPMSEFNAFVCDMYQSVKGNGVVKFIDDCMTAGKFKTKDKWFMWDEDNYEVVSGQSPFDFVFSENALVDILVDEENALEEIGFSHEEAEKIRQEVNRQ